MPQPLRKQHTPEGRVKIGAASRLTGYSTDALRRWSDEGKIPFARTPGGQRTFLIADLERLLMPTPATK